MVQFLNLPERKPSKGEKLAGAVSDSTQMIANQIALKKENEFLKNMGIDVSGIHDPEIRKMVIGERLKSETKAKEAEAKGKQDVQTTFTPILEELKSLKDATGPLNIAGHIPWTEAAGKRAKIETLRLSLEGLFRDLTLKGQFPKAIYERILEKLPSENDTETKYLHKIEALEDIIRAHSQGGSEGGSKAASKTEPAKGKVKFNPKNKEHLSKMQQLERKFKGDRAKVNEALAREFE